ncbi:putative clathrin assembly protein At1g14910 [Zingiber officinale]|uniref:putative clathrin assembly protein At1g14910 n=1 Tax=Zingiber officinale TaxID=94328 RepID=UPI001C4D77C2|nr:putative clathrin assembly protein At1g14910 [Zingiber officinale]
MVDDEKTSLDEPEFALAPIELTIATPTHKADSSDTVLSETNTKAPAVEENNSSALTIVPTSTTTDSGTIQDGAFDPTEWELALATTPSNNNSTVLESRMFKWLPWLSNSSKCSLCSCNRIHSFSQSLHCTLMLGLQ